jgi:ankyrin repeat protein
VVFSAQLLIAAAGYGMLEAVQVLINEAGADVGATHNGFSSLHAAAHHGHVAVVRCLVEYGADVNQATYDGSINKALSNGATPLMAASYHKHMEVVVWLIKHGANAQASHQDGSTAADISRKYGASVEQTEYLEARAHCANSGCDGAGLKKCAGCLKVFFCSPMCIRAHWPAHKTECKRIAEAAASKAN